MLTALADWLIPAIFLLVPMAGLCRGLPVYDLFVEGAAEGLKTALRIAPYLIAMLSAVAVFRESGAFSVLARWLSPLTDGIGLPPEVLPLALLRPFSGSGSLALLADVLESSGPDSFAGLLASVMQGSTDTTFYVLSVYFGAVGVKHYRYAPMLGLTADICGFLAAFCICRRMFG